MTASDGKPRQIDVVSFSFILFFAAGQVPEPKPVEDRTGLSPI